LVDDLAIRGNARTLIQAEVDRRLATHDPECTRELVQFPVIPTVRG
jgi:hypothetical protein